MKVIDRSFKVSMGNKTYNSSIVWHLTVHIQILILMSISSSEQFVHKTCLPKITLHVSRLSQEKHVI